MLKLSSQTAVAVAFERMSFKKGSNYKALTEKILVFWISDRLREVVVHEGSTILHSNYNWDRQKHDFNSDVVLLPCL